MGYFSGLGERDFDQVSQILALQNTDDEIAHRIGLFPTRDILRVDLEFGTTFIQISNYNFGLRQVELAIVGNIAEHEIEHARHQQWNTKHEDDRKRTAEGTGQIFQGDVKCFHGVIPLIAQGTPSQVQKHSFQIRLADIHRGNADR